MESNASRAVFERYLRAINAQDVATLRQLVHPDFEDFYPQSGELIRGIENLGAILSNYPGAVEGLGTHRVVGGEERFVRSPLFTVIRVEGNEDALTGVSRLRYPDGSLWFAVNLCEMRDGLVYRLESYFAPAFDPPDWRAAWVEARPGPTE